MQLRQVLQKLLEAINTFSILGRIERDATSLVVNPLLLSDNLSVSSDGSNGMQRGYLLLTKDGNQILSVSSDGSNGMQLWQQVCEMNDDLTFSILGRIERDATFIGSRDQGQDSRLSVSSDGSNGMQRLAGPGPGGLSGPFQYPRTDRTGCNDDEAGARHLHLAHLSVSSDGSNGMQLLRSHGRHGWSCTFSILGRIERDATTFWPALWAGLTAFFQYPRTDRTGCNLLFWGEITEVARLSVSSDGSNGMQPPRSGSHRSKT